MEYLHDHAFICKILIDFDQKKSMLKFDFFKQFHVERNKVKLFILFY